MSPLSPLPPSQTVTGDTIVSSKASAVAAARRAQNEGEGERRRGKGGGEQSSLVLAGVEVPDPVFFCSIEPPTMSKQTGRFPQNTYPLPKQTPESLPHVLEVKSSDLSGLCHVTAWL